jgi:microfibrillar-associated protein 1
MSTFNARDLALILPDEVDAVSLRMAASKADDTLTFLPLVPKIDKSKKVTRYFPQQAPSWDKMEIGEGVGESRREVNSSSITSSSSNKGVIDKRLARLSQTSSAASSDSVGTGRRKRYEAEVIRELNDDDDKTKLVENLPIDRETPIMGEEDRDQEEDVAARRARIKQNMQTKAFDEGSTVFTREEPGEEDEEDDDEYETDSDDYEEDDREILKPVFVPKAKRETIIEQERRYAEEQAALDRKQEHLEERKRQTRVMVAESIKRFDEKNDLDMTDADSDAGIPDDTDDADDEEVILSLLLYVLRCS